MTSSVCAWTRSRHLRHQWEQAILMKHLQGSIRTVLSFAALVSIASDSSDMHSCAAKRAIESSAWTHKARVIKLATISTAVVLLFLLGFCTLLLLVGRISLTISIITVFFAYVFLRALRVRKSGLASKGLADVWAIQADAIAGSEACEQCHTSWRRMINQPRLREIAFFSFSSRSFWMLCVIVALCAIVLLADISWPLAPRTKIISVGVFSIALVCMLVVSLILTHNALRDAKSRIRARQCVTCGYPLIIPDVVSDNEASSTLRWTICSECGEPAIVDAKNP